MGRYSSFIDQFTSPSTVNAYRWSIKNFLEWVYSEKVDVNSERALDKLCDRYFAENRDYKKDLTGYFGVINKRPRNTVRMLLAGVRQLLEENDVELSGRFWKKLRRSIPRGTVTDEIIPSNEDLRKIIMHLPVEGKALALMLASSGMRIGELCRHKKSDALELDDIDLDSDPVKVTIRGSVAKYGIARITFISKEAKEALLEWLKIRAHSNDIGDNNKLVFPYSYQNYTQMWKRALRKTGNAQRDKNTHIHRMRIHTLRKLFSAKAGAVSIDMAEALMGHQGYLRGVYRKYADPGKSLAEFYRRVEPLLAVFGVEADAVASLRQEIDKDKDVVTSLAERLTMVERENVELKRKLNDYLLTENQIANLLKRIETLEKQAQKQK